MSTIENTPFAGSSPAMRTIFIIPLIMEVIVNFTKNQWPWLNKFKIVQRCSGSFRDVTFYCSTAALRFSPMRNTPKVDCRTAPTTCGLLWALIVFWGCGKDTPFGKEHHFELAAEIPIGKTTVEILQMRYSERTEELSQRMSVTVATNKVWWFDYLKKHIDEHPLPYHTNLGLTKLEYTELLEGYEKTRRLQKVSDAYLIFKRKGDLLSIDIGDANSPIKQWRLNLLRACLKIERGPAAADFAGGQGGEARASPQRAARAEPTRATGKSRAARRVFAEWPVWRRCSSLADPLGYARSSRLAIPAIPQKQDPFEFSDRLSVENCSHLWVMWKNRSGEQATIQSNRSESTKGTDGTMKMGTLR